MATNPFYQSSGQPGSRSGLSSAAVRAQFAALQLAFDKLNFSSYTPVASAYTGGLNSAGFSLCYYIQIGNMVLVLGKFIAGTGGAAGGSFQVPLPVPTNLSATVYVSGGLLSEGTGNLSLYSGTVASGSGNTAKFTTAGGGTDPGPQRHFWFFYPVA